MYDPLQDALYFRFADASDIDQIFSLEAEGYPEDEAASKASLHFRQENAREAFLVAVKQNRFKDGDSNAPGARELIVGYVCGTLTAADSLTHESMQSHNPEGNLLCIHSVCVAQTHRRKGIAKRMLKGYNVMIRNVLTQVRSIHLLCKEGLIELYKTAGFQLLGPSSVVHGKEQWFEMRQIVRSEACAEVHDL